MPRPPNLSRRAELAWSAALVTVPVTVGALVHDAVGDLGGLLAFALIAVMLGVAAHRTGLR